MKNREFRRFLLACLGIAGLLLALPAASAAAEVSSARDLQREVGVRELEALFAEYLGSSHVTPAFTDLGDGFFSLSITLEPEMRERLLEAARSGDLTGNPARAQQTLFVISAGQAPVPPSNPIDTTHGALSDTTFTYNYWIIVLNLSNQNVRRTTTAKLSGGPGLKFNKSIQATYNAGGIWMVFYNPGRGVSQPGIYTFQATVAGGGSITNKTFAVNP